ncbi:protein-glutamate methylesterase/protein-glutamine glutaminase [Rhodocyclus tenuis]|uniref:Protein-glutamate methylesterase/protein-glutamine glutaminase n=1 Tax=Rhodocyclus tenuis TaxID=1066 RepID=A0A840G669_RHOTE|nr:chemotaxis response regulator protein-glutamate methylesterase [Rhodocyclus tenuis]MBB4246881.1 two-component system chemotaxis response regulator CheB [Rhodocyclus tenuis]MBK1680176.1 chemotaxis response regulator protein-glutamate methylesterase [Rhodocyclus tenuis]
MSTDKIKVMIVDDSALVRQVVSQALAREPGIEVIATASDPLFALEKMKAQWPDVLVIDIEMPRMDGISFLRKVMSEHPTPVVVCSSLAESGAQATFDALAAGAVSIITKPKAGLKNFLEDSANDIVNAVRAAARANVRLLTKPHVSPSPGSYSLAAPPPLPLRAKNTADVILPAGSAGPLVRTTEQVIAIGTSTGGTQALEAVLTRLPATCLGIVVVQHMPEKFTAMFAERLNSLCKIEVREAKNGDRVTPGRALIAPGGKHMLLKRSGAQYIVDVVDGPLVNRHKPSVDVLFRSVARFAGGNALGIIMTGMGDDGARGLKEMHEAGAHTVAQDEASCVVFGMPKEAIKLGAADQVVALDRIPEAISIFCRSAG